MKLSRNLIPDLAVLQAFESAARHGSFTQAATELSLTQSAVSRQIKTLEAQLGTNLFERVRQRVVLSAAGHKLLPRVRQLLRQSENMVINARASVSAENVLSVASLPTFGSRWLVPRLPDFLKKHPGTVLNIASRSEPFDFEAEDFDIAIHYGQPVWAHATCTYLCSETVVPVASPGLLAERPVGDIGDIEKMPLVHLATRPEMWAEWFERNGLDWNDAYRGNRFDQFAMVIEAATLGVGMALVPDYLIEGEIETGRLKVVFDRPLSTENNYYVVLPEGKQESPIGRSFQAWLLDQVGKPRPSAG
jgi:LysR family glycine cleavage system transcriptional activator